MTVADLIRDLAGLPPDAPVVIAESVMGTVISENSLDGIKLVIGTGECPHCDGYGYDPADVDESEDCPRCDGMGTLEGAPTAYLMLGGSTHTALSYRTIQEG